MRALLAYSCGVDEHAGNDHRAAVEWVRESLAADRPVLLCVDRWEHWVTLIGATRRTFTLYDPARDTGGAFVLRDKHLRSRWEAAKRVRGREGRFYGIAVGAPDGLVGGRVVR